MSNNEFFKCISRVDGFSVVAIGQTLSYINRLSDLQSWSYRKPSDPEVFYDAWYLLREYLKQQSVNIWNNFCRSFCSLLSLAISSLKCS